VISVAEARAAILSAAEPVDAENVRLRHALGRTLREDLIAARDHPPFRASAMDGYAVRASDTPGALRVIGEAGAGNALQVPLAPGECARIFTGAPLPVGADAILIQEDAVRDQDIVTAPQIAPARHVRDAGIDFRAGDRVLTSGVTLNAVSIALAATLGRNALTVSKRPRVAVLGGGDELVTPGDTPLADQVFDSMSFAVAALVEQWGGGASTAPPLKDRGADVARAIAETLTPNDLTVIIGGASVGDHDHARPAVRELGGEILFEKVSLRPGKPTWFARIEKNLVLGLPGNPASAMVCARLFLRPLLDKLCGQEPGASTRTIAARTRSPLAANGVRETYLRAAIESDETGQLWVKAAAQQDSSLISVFAAAPALVMRPPDAPATAEGALVEVLCP
jgi:molybdopterin molybdotransferase